jgi:hypothetical protein
MQDCDDKWEKVIFSLVSCEFPHAKKICGAKVHDKYGKYRIDLWTTYSGECEDHSDIMEYLKSVIGMESPVFKQH